MVLYLLEQIIIKSIYNLPYNEKIWLHGYKWFKQNDINSCKMNTDNYHVEPVFEV